MLFRSRKGMRTVEVGAAVGADDLHPRAIAEAQQMPQQEQRGLGRPVQVVVDRNPPFTVNQLEALVIPEVFPVIDWPAIFGVAETPLRQALEETYLDPRYAQIVLDF